MSKWQRGKGTFHFMIIFKLCPGAYTRGRGKRRALACEMFKMHAYELDTRCAFSISYPEWTSQPTNRLTEKKKRITNVFVMNDRKSIGKIRAIEFMWMCVCALRGERNTQPKRGKINGEHNRKARANFSHSLSLCITVRSRILPVIFAHEKLQNQQRITLTHCAQIHRLKKRLQHSSKKPLSEWQKNDPKCEKSYEQFFGENFLH